MYIAKEKIETQKIIPLIDLLMLDPWGESYYFSIFDLLYRSHIYCVILRTYSISKHTQQFINKIKSKYPNTIIGIRNVYDIYDCTKIIENCNINFITSPTFNKQISELCYDKNILYYPGACTPSEFINIYNSNHYDITFFPADIYGGIKTLEYVSFLAVDFIIDGGVDINNIISYLDYYRVKACIWDLFFINDTRYFSKNLQEYEKTIIQILNKIKKTDSNESVS